MPVNLKTNKIKISGVYFSYKRSLENDENYRRYVINTKKLLKLWRMRQLKIEGKISIFKRLYNNGFHASKVIPLFLIKNHSRKNFIFPSNLSNKAKSC